MEETMLNLSTADLATGSSQATILAWLIIMLPLVGATVLLVGGKALNAIGHWLAVVAAFAAFACGLATFIPMLGRPAGERAFYAPLYDWMTIPGIDTQLGLRVDQLSIVFVLLITGVGSLIHLYSVGYMAHDPNRRKLFAYLNLFLAAMLTLVLGSSFLVLFVGWEGVGLASYLLISFWNERPAAAAAGVKAFVMNRIGDVGMVLGISAMFAMFGTTSFEIVNQNISGISGGWVTLLGFFLLAGACAKSAQVPLQAWLLDAMEGPTPVSALIHAATMVTAGVYLVVRAGSIYQLSEVAQTAVVIVGTVTLLVGAWIGCAKDDIKKVLAGSTMSQIGYMILAAGIGPAGYALAIFHLVTHGFFKANMFLGAGSVMHAMNDSVNMRLFGALRTAMPITFLTFAAGYLAIIGFPGFAGFYSKDAIIEIAFEQSFLIGLATLVGAGVTAFYMTRLMMMTYFGRSRWREDMHPHDASPTMAVALIILGILSVIGGLVLAGGIATWLNPAIGGEAENVPLFHITGLTAVTLIVVALGVFSGWYLFRSDIPTERTAPGLLTQVGDNAFYGDSINNWAVVAPTTAVGSTLAVLDNVGINTAVDDAGAGLAGLGHLIGTKLQNGAVRTYGVLMVGGVLVLAIIAFVAGLVG